MTIRGNDIIALVTGGTLEDYTAGTGINAPVISAVAGTDSITVTIDGDSGVTNEVNYKLSTDSEWSDGGSRSGDGDVVISDLTAGTYQVVAYSSNDGVLSVPSNMVDITIADSPEQGDDYVSGTAITVTVDEDDIIVTIAGQTGAVHRVLYKATTEVSWKEGGVRTGDGTVTISSLSAATYHVQVKSI